MSLRLGKRLAAAPGEAKLLPSEWKLDALNEALLAPDWPWRILSWGQPLIRLRLPRTALTQQVLGSTAMTVRRLFNPLAPPSSQTWQSGVSLRAAASG